MIEHKELEQRIYISDLLDGDETLQEVKLTLEEVVWEDGFTNHLKSFELNGEYVTYTELSDLFGKAKIGVFIEDALQNAR